LPQARSTRLLERALPLRRPAAHNQPAAPPPQAVQHAHIQFSLKLGGNSVSGAGGSGPLSNLGNGTNASQMLGGGGGMLPEATPGLHYFPEVPEGRPSREQDLADLMLSMQVGFRPISGCGGA
jgi:hypothetical protein